jgi:hypothetical protein
MTEVGGFKFAGQGQSTPATWEWVEAERRWYDRGPSFGTVPCIYDRRGVLHVFQFAGPGTSVDGYRYLAADGRIVTGQETLTDRALEISEWSVAGPFTIGQGWRGGIEAIEGGARYLLETGDVHTIRARVGDDVPLLAVATRKLAERETVLLWATLDAVRALPTEVIPRPPDKPPVDPPDPVEVPVSEGITAAQLATLITERQKYPPTTERALTPEEIGAIINAACWRHRDDPNRPGMQRKPSGTVAIQPRTGITIWNGIRYRDDNGDHWGEDICGGCSVGRFDPIHQTPGRAIADTFVAPVNPEDDGPPVDPLPGTPPSGELADRVTALEGQMKTVAHKGDGVTTTQTGTIDK